MLDDIAAEYSRRFCTALVRERAQGAGRPALVSAACARLPPAPRARRSRLLGTQSGRADVNLQVWHADGDEEVLWRMDDEERRVEDVWWRLRRRPGVWVSDDERELDAAVEGLGLRDPARVPPNPDLRRVLPRRARLLARYGAARRPRGHVSSSSRGKEVETSPSVTDSCSSLRSHLGGTRRGCRSHRSGGCLARLHRARGDRRGSRSRAVLSPRDDRVRISHCALLAASRAWTTGACGPARPAGGGPTRERAPHHPDREVG